MALEWTERYGVHQALVGGLFLISIGHVGDTHVVTIYSDGGQAHTKLPGSFPELEGAKRHAVAYLRNVLTTALQALD